jgi:hypothetical protein
MLGSGATDAEAASVRMAVVAVGAGLTGGGLALISKPAAYSIAAGTTVKEVFGSAAADVPEIMSLAITAASQSDIDTITSQMTQRAVVAGAYAGKAWPFPMDQRVMPRYDIVGGPRIKVLKDGTKVILKQTQPLSLLRVN